MNARFKVGQTITEPHWSENEQELILAVFEYQGEIWYLTQEARYADRDLIVGCATELRLARDDNHHLRVVPGFQVGDRVRVLPFNEGPYVVQFIKGEQAIIEIDERLVAAHRDNLKKVTE